MTRAEFAEQDECNGGDQLPHGTAECLKTEMATKESLQRENLVLSRRCQALEDLVEQLKKRVYSLEKDVGAEVARVESVQVL